MKSATPRPRFSIAIAMAAIAVIALWMLALSRPTRLGAALSYSFVLLAVTYATVAALILRGSARNAWVGFAAGGGIYLFVAFPPFSEASINNRRSLLLPTFFLDAAYPWLGEAGMGPVKPVSPLKPVNPWASPPGLVLPVPLLFEQQGLKERWARIDRTPGFPDGLPASAPYYHTGHAMFALLAALAMAGLANAFVPKSPPE